VTLSTLKRYEQAAEAFARATKIKPDYMEAHFNLGLTESRLERHKEAVESFRQAARFKPDFAEAHYNAGVELSIQSLWQEAAEAYLQAVRIRPDYIDARYNLALVYKNLGNKEAAMQQCEAIKSLDAELAKKLAELIQK
jgi:tetratricopeptide (TPR) repeat protein